MGDYDAIVVGAGPAGATAAFWLGEAGKRVLVLEKERLPRYKPCGGGVPRAALASFPFGFAPVIEREVRQVCFRFRDGRQVMALLPGAPVAMVMRDRFDYHILRHARAEVRDGSPLMALREDEGGVEVTTRAGETFRTRYLIGADGAVSRVARLVGLKYEQPMGIALEVEVATGSAPERFADTALFIFGATPWGYLWVFPKAEGLSVGIGHFSGSPSGLRETLRREMGRLGIIVDGRPQRGHPLPIYRRHRPLRRGRVLLVGDAAGLVDPLLGEGIRHAITSGRFAAEAILADDLSGYTWRVQREIGRDLLWGRCWAWPFYEHPWGSFELAVRNPRFLAEFVRLLSGQTTYRRMALRAPLNLLLGLPRRHPAH